MNQSCDDSIRGWPSSHTPRRHARPLASNSAVLAAAPPSEPPRARCAQDLHVYVDGLSDLSMLVRDAKTSQYAPHGKAWIKGQILSRLKAAA